MERNKPPIVEKPPQPQLSSLSEQLSSLHQLAETIRQKELWKDEVEIKVQTRGLPFMLIGLSDLHIGSRGVDFQALERYLNFIKTNPVYTVLIGDLADNFSPTSHPDGMMKDLVNPSDQWAVARAFFKEYEDKILAVVSGGQHDFWQEDKSGIDIYRWLTDDLNIPLLEAGGLLRLKIDEAEFKVRLWHKIARLNSQFNLTHAGFQALRLSGDDADLVISGDKHLGGLAVQDVGKKRIVCQLGTFKTNDQWARRQGMVQRPKPFYPVFMFFPETHNIEAVENLDQAEELIGGMQKYYKQKAVSLLGIKK
uniref:Calcineurin-like phosphoesterase domain-containing protein n=1 Tax=candidate division CPR3 bacterium TaxID=2268181 RepID=A0A7C5YW54_UNCC3